MQLTREQLLQFLSPAVADAVLADPGEPLAGRPLEVSVLSCDVSAFRARAEAEPAAALQLLSRILAEITAVVFAHDGTLMSFPGDGVLAVFGAPLPSADHQLIAKRAEAEMLGAALQRINAALGSEGHDPVAIEVATASGPAVVGVVGADPRWEYVVIGEVTGRAIAATSGDPRSPAPGA